MKSTILIADCSTDVVAQISDILVSTNNGYSIVATSEGKSACEKAIEYNPDLIILDWEMSAENGNKIIKFLKDNALTKEIPIILLTSTNNLEQAFNTGATDFLNKPIDPNKLLLRIETTLSFSQSLKAIHEQQQKIEKQALELEEQKQIIAKQSEKADQILLNILPYEIAEQLKKKGSAKPKLYKKVTVLFTDFKDFSKISTALSPEELIEALSFYFENFDEIIGKHYIEKIKTIGDAYMCAGGLPLKNRSNPFDITLAALNILNFINTQKKVNIENNKPIWECRIGIHTGEVIAGVIGKRKFAYDIWGDTVNTASRMESNGEVGKINISGSTYNEIKDFFDCEYRGKVNVRNIGEVDMYFVKRLKPEYSEDEIGMLPNAEFNKMLAKL